MLSLNDAGPVVKQHGVWKMKTRSAIAAASLCGLALAIAGCGSSTADWNKASNENTVAAYQGFVAAHPKDPHASEAQALILQLQDDNSWAEAKRTATTAAYQTYLQQYPQGAHAGDARDAMKSMDRAAAWKTAQGAATATSVQAFLRQYPTGPEADQAKAKLKDLTGYRVRLASEPSEDRAQRKLARLQARFGEQLQGLLVTPDANGKSFSVDSAGMTEPQARTACEAVKHKHQGCQVVQN